MISFQNVKKVYRANGNQTVEALKGINMKVEKGDIFGVVGFSGAGKSTLIRLVNLLETPSEGKVLVDGKNLNELKPNVLRREKKNIGMIFQHFNLLNSKTVFNNIAMPLILSKTPRKEIKKRVDELLQFVGLADKANSYPDQLSGGQKQRIGIARALATNPSILLCDEATSALDPQTTSSILQLLKEINEKYNITILLITHEMSVIKEICNKVAVMENGVIVEQGNVYDIFSNPNTSVAKSFVRTVIHDQVPQSILAKEIDLGKTIWQLKFNEENTNKKLVSQLIKQFNLEVTILSAHISEIQSKSFGNIIIEVEGDEADKKKALEYIFAEKIIVKEVNINE